MSESLAQPLADAVRELGRHFPAGERHEVIDFAVSRCNSNAAQTQYVVPGRVEAWQRKHVRELALDTLEEVGDAIAYVAAIIHKDHERKDEWLTVALFLSWAFDSVSDLGWEVNDGE